MTSYTEPGLIMPSSVTIASMYAAGVLSNTGLNIFTESRTSPGLTTSEISRSSMVTESPNIVIGENL